MLVSVSISWLDHVTVSWSVICSLQCVCVRACVRERVHVFFRWLHSLRHQNIFTVHSWTCPSLPQEQRPVTGGVRVVHMLKQKPSSILVCALIVSSTVLSHFYNFYRFTSTFMLAHAVTVEVKQYFERTKGVSRHFTVVGLRTIYRIKAKIHQPPLRSTRRQWRGKTMLSVGGHLPRLVRMSRKWREKNRGQQKTNNRHQMKQRAGW